MQTGFSELRNGYDAAIEAVKMSMEKFEGEPELVLLFSNTGYDQLKVLSGIKEVLPTTNILGCSAEGVIFADGSSESGYALTLMLIGGEGLTFNYFFEKKLAENPAEIGCKYAQFLNTLSLEQKMLNFLYPDGLTINATKFFNALNSNLEGSPVILGGTAGEMYQLKQTYQYFNGEVYSDCCVGVSIGGDFSFDYYVNHGCTPIGSEKVITKAEGNWVYELDGEPTWTVMQKYVGANIDKLGGDIGGYISVGEICDGAIGSFKVHAPTAQGKSGEIRFPQELEVGKKVIISRRNPMEISRQAVESGKTLSDNAKKPIAVFQYDCGGRGRILFGDELDDLITRPLQKCFESNIPWIGFHTYGEIAPYNGENAFHNYTLVLCVLYERC